MIAARPAALNCRFRFLAGLPGFPLRTLAHRARAAAAIRARPAADIRRFFGTSTPVELEISPSPKIASSRPFNCSIFSLMERILRNCFVDKFCMSFMLDRL